MDANPQPPSAAHAHARREAVAPSPREADAALGRGANETPLPHLSEGPREGDACAECLDAVPPDAERDKEGAPLCRACVENFYVACAACGRLVARDEALEPRGTSAERNPDNQAGATALVCAACFADALPERISDEEMETLVAQFVELHAEKKRLDERLEELKERLKTAAEGRQRVEGAVVMRAGEVGVRVSYTVKTTAQAERVAALASMLDAEEFAALFKTSYSPVKDRVDEFLALDDEAHAAAREALRAAIQQNEVATLNVLTPKKPRAPRSK